MYDAIVVGARCAGSPTAMRLARAGYRVLLLDKARFPSDTLSVHYIHQPGIAALKRWGLLDAVIASNCPAVQRQTMDFGPFRISGSPPPSDGTSEGYAPRRLVLDKILVDAAAKAGAEVRERFTVTGLEMDGDHVTGVRGHAAAGANIVERARIVIGADGIHSRVAREARAPAYNERPALTCAYYSYWSDLPVNGVELYPRPDHMIAAGPTNDGKTLIIIYWPASSFHEVRKDIEGSFLASLALVPDLAERVQHAHRDEPFRGTADLPNFFRRPYGPGWALVGDAGYHKDPITAQGITDAFRDAELLATAIDNGLAGRRPLIDALMDYERARNEAVMPMYELTCQLAGLQLPPPEMQHLLGVISQDPVQTSRYIGTVAGTVPIPEFFAPENIERILGESAHTAA